MNAPRFSFIGPDGQSCTDVAIAVAVHDHKLELIWSKDHISAKRMTWDAARKACADFELAGFSDWRLPEVEELFQLSDRARYNPAIDTDFFPGTESEWYWTNTVDASSSSVYAWGVCFHGGESYYLNQHYEAFVRAVRSSRASQ